MVARYFILFLSLIILPDMYFYWHYLGKHKNFGMARRLLWWLPSIALTAFTLGLLPLDNFIPDNPQILYLYLFLIASIAIPKAVFALCSFAGLVYCRLTHTRKNWGNVAGVLASLFGLFVLLYGITIGVNKLEVHALEYRSEDLPEAFDGYRIVHISDLHVGTFGNNTSMIEKTVDSINAQHADLIVFTGDLQNAQPSELDPFQSILSKMKAKDGVYSVLGNHDYAEYIKADPATEALNEQLTKSKQRSMGWNLLLNEWKAVHRGNDSIVIAGMENDGLPPFPKKGDVKQTIKGIGNGAFTIMLQHDPIAWRRHILPQSNAQLTLSGHTHASQFKIMGWSPISLKYKEWGGQYYAGTRAIFVNTGIGGVVPIRFGVPATISVITLHKK